MFKKKDQERYTGQTLDEFFNLVATILGLLFVGNLLLSVGLIGIGALYITHPFIIALGTISVLLCLAGLGAAIYLAYY